MQRFGIRREVIGKMQIVEIVVQGGKLPLRSLKLTSMVKDAMGQITAKLDQKLVQILNTNEGPSLSIGFGDAGIVIGAGGTLTVQMA